MTQALTFHCEHCGAEAVVVRLSPYLFDAICLCGFAYVLAWTTKDPPPAWTPPAGQLAFDWMAP